MAALKRKQNWPLGVDKGQRVLMQTPSGRIQKLARLEKILSGEVQQPHVNNS